MGINKIGNIYALPLDNMPCLVPFDYYTKNNNMSVIKMDNGFYTPVQIPNPLFNGNNATSILFLQPK